MQRCFWVGTTSDREATIAKHLPDHLFARGGLAVVFGLVLLVFAQLVFSRLENKIPERI
jgi:ABC-2 type transport system permease protein